MKRICKIRLLTLVFLFFYVCSFGQEVDWVILPKYDSIIVVKKGISIVKLNNKFGCIDESGEIIIPTIYDYIDNKLYGDLIFVKREGKKGYLDLQGKVIIPCEFEKLTEPNEGFVVGLKEDKWQYINTSGIAITKLEYDEAFLFKNGLAKVQKKNKKGKKYGFIDYSGKVVVPIEYDDTSDFFDDLSKVKKKGKIGYINSKGEITLPLVYLEGTTFYNNHAVVCVKSDGIPSFKFEGGFEVLYSGEWNVVNKNGEVKAKIYGICEDLGRYVRLTQKDKNYDIGNALEDYVYQKNSRPTEHSGLIDKKGISITPIVYKSIKSFDNGYTIVDDNGKVGFLNSEGKIVIKPIFDKISNFSYGVMQVTKGQLVGGIDSTGKLIIPVAFEKFNTFTDVVTPFTKGKKYGFIDRTGNIVLPETFDFATNIIDGIGFIRKQNKIGVINSRGKEIVPSSYENGHFCNDGLFGLQKNKWALFNKGGEQITSFIFEDILEVSEGVLPVKKGGKWGIIKNPLKNNSVPVISEPNTNANNTIYWTSPNARKYIQEPLKVSQDRLNIEAVISSNLSEKQLREALQVRVNGMLQKGKLLGNVSLKAQQQVYDFEQSVHVEEGANKIEIIIAAPNQEVIKSIPLNVLYTPPQKANLYLFTFGVQFPDLNYTDEDATVIHQLFSSQRGLLFNQIFSDTPLINNNTNADAIGKEFERLGNRDDIREQDVVLVFGSSHGGIFNDKFRIYGRDFEDTAPRKTTIDFNEDIIANLDKLNCKKVILLDACRSGASVGKSKTDANTLIANTPPGTVIITSSSKSERSYENEAWQNSSFVKAIKEGLEEAKANTDGDGYVTIKELFSYLQKRVPSLVKSVKALENLPQNPQMKMENLQDFPIYKVK
jgi:hypothetical protein